MILPDTKIASANTEPVPVETGTPALPPPAAARIRYWIGLTGAYMSVQAMVQLLSFATGIIIIRSMSQREYAFYTIANSMQGTMNLLADIGISNAVMAIGGRVWQDRTRLGELMQTALRLRYWLAARSMFVVGPVLVWLLLRQGASIANALLLVAIVVSGFVIQLPTNLLMIAPRLHAQLGRLQRIDLISASARCVLVATACLLWLNSGTALIATVLTAGIQFRILRSWAADLVNFEANPTEEDRAEMLKVIRSQAPNAIYYCFQGQITIWLISTFGKAQSVAEVGALGRLALVFTVISSVLAGMVIPRFARCQDPNLLWRRYWQILALCALLALAIMIAAALFTPQFLWLLGSKYQHLKPEFIIMVLSNIVAFIAGVMWSLNAARAWFKYSWLYIPLTLATQALLLTLLNVSTVRGVLVFSLFSQVPLLFLNAFLAWRGLKREFARNAPAEAQV